MQQITEYIAQNQQRFINELIELLKIPSVSADPLLPTTFCKPQKP